MKPAYYQLIFVTGLCIGPIVWAEEPADASAVVEAEEKVKVAASAETTSAKTEVARAVEGEGPVGREDKAAVEANSRFAWNLYAQLVKENPHENLFFSPISVSSALLLVAEGARGETAEEMGVVLGLPESLRRKGADSDQQPWDFSPLHRWENDQLRRYERIRGSPEQLKIGDEIEAVRKRRDEVEALWRKSQAGPVDPFAYGGRKWEEEFFELLHKEEALLRSMESTRLSGGNKLWGEATLGISKSFLDKISLFYGEDAVEPVQFLADPEGARRKIDFWAEEMTKGRLSKLFPEGEINRATTLAVANAVYFKAQWLTPFHWSKTRRAPFHLDFGGKLQTPMMFQTVKDGGRYGAFNADGSVFDTPELIGPRAHQETGADGEKPALYPDGDGFVIVEIPYRGRNAAMVVIAPRSHSGLPALERMITPEKIESWVASLKQREFHLFLPKFKAQHEYRMDGLLGKMGMPAAFTRPQESTGADFSGIFQDKAMAAYLQQFWHGSFIEVNEEGTEASVLSSAAVGGKPFGPTFRADRPFIYLIRDTNTGAILFMGRMLEPTLTEDG